MPGLSKNVDTDDWTARDWRHARNWNFAFLVGWLAFFGLALRANLQPINLYILVPMLLIGVIGGAIQIAWLMRVSIQLDNQKKPKTAP